MLEVDGEMAKPNSLSGKPRLNVDGTYTAECINAFIALQKQRLQIRTAQYVWFGRQAEWRVLSTLALASIENRDADITTIVADSGMPRSTVKRVIDLLVERGDVRLERSSSDRRRLMVIQSDQSLQSVVAILNELMDATFAFANEFPSPVGEP